MTTEEKRPSKRLFCEHCGDYVSKTLYYQHRRLYYNKQSKKWSSVRVYAQEDTDTDDAPFTVDVNSATSDGKDEDVDDFALMEEPENSPEVVAESTNAVEQYDCHIIDGNYVDKSHWIIDDGPEFWSDEDLHNADELQSTDGKDKVHDDSTDNKMIKVYIFFLFMFQTLFRLSDVALRVLLMFLAMFLDLLAKSFNLVRLQAFVTKLPRTVRSARNCINNTRDNFQKFVCCPECHNVYTRNECIVSDSRGQQVSKKCPYVRFPSHPQPQHRTPCGAVLMKTVKSSTGKTFLYPKLVYCYRSVITSLQQLILRPHFMTMCESWRQRSRMEDVLRDVYDGNVWKDFMSYDGKPFLDLPFNFALHLNVDWFQPFDHTQHSEGVIYLTITNLERKQRFLQENVILVGVIPGPREPQFDINSFLKPLVDDLLLLWNGVLMDTIEGLKVVVRAGLLCAACDIPAARKTCGFVGCSAYHGCSKCLVTFPTAAFGEKTDYSNFNKSEWGVRTNQTHRMVAFQYRDCNTQSKQNEIQREHGVRYSVLLELPYFDAPRMCIIDPMHNLLLGTAKHMIDVWKKLGLLESKHFVLIQQRIDGFVVPGTSGRQPTSNKILSGFSGFTAEQWKSWTLCYSLFCLKGILPFQHYRCWQIFVKACSLICRRTVTLPDVEEADSLLLEFCLQFVRLYGKDYCTPNMHLHCHLKECILDYGPVYAFWLFGYERLNGVMGSYHTNCHNISVQLTRRFLDSTQYAPSNWPKDVAADFVPLAEQCRYNLGSLLQTSLDAEMSLSVICPLPPLQERCLHPEQVVLVQNAFKIMYGDAMHTVLLLYKCAEGLKIGTYVIGSSGPRYYRSSVVLALKRGVLSLAKVEFYAECSVISEESNTTHTEWLAAVSWFTEHPCRVWYGNPTQVWCTTTDLFEFIPVRHIKCRVVYVKASVYFGRVVGADSVLIVSPLEF